MHPFSCCNRTRLVYIEHMETIVYHTLIGSDAWKLAGALGRASLRRRVEEQDGSFNVIVNSCDMGKAVGVRDKWEVGQ